MSEAWITQSGQGDGAGGGQVWSGSSGGQELEPEDKAREVRWCVVDAVSEKLRGARPRLVFIAPWPQGCGWEGECS